MPAFIKTTFPFSSPATERARPSTRSCLRSMALRSRSLSPALSRPAIISSAAAERRSPLSPGKPGFPSTPWRRQESRPPEAPHLHINNVNAYHGRLKQWLNRFNGVATKNLPNYLGWRRALEAWGHQLAPANLDQRRYRKRPVPTDNAIIAQLFSRLLRIGGCGIGGSGFAVAVPPIAKSRGASPQCEWFGARGGKRSPPGDGLVQGSASHAIGRARRVRR